MDLSAPATSPSKALQSLHEALSHSAKSMLQAGNLSQFESQRAGYPAIAGNSSQIPGIFSKLVANTVMWGPQAPKSCPTETRSQQGYQNQLKSHPRCSTQGGKAKGIFAKTVLTRPSSTTFALPLRQYFVKCQSSSAQHLG